MKRQLKHIALILAVGLLAFSCSKEETTDEEILQTLQKVTLQIGVRDASATNTALEGAEVSTLVNGTVVSATTNSFGVAEIPGVDVGDNLEVTVSKEDYTTVALSVDAIPADYRQRTVSVVALLYAVNGDNVATVKGNISAETDLTNRERESLEGVQVFVRNYSLDNINDQFVGTTDAEGNYSIAVPINGTGANDVELYFPDVQKERTVGVNKNNVYAVETKNALYAADSYSATPVESVPSALISIAAPSAAGTGFQLKAVRVATPLSSIASNHTDYEAIITGGSGYVATEAFIYEADANGNRAEMHYNVDANGTITSVSFVDNGAVYLEMPEVTTNPANGSGAEFSFTEMYFQHVIIENHGSGYVNVPTTHVRYYTTYDGSSSKTEEYEDITNWIEGLTIIRNGEIVSPTGNDTLAKNYNSFEDYEFIHDVEDKTNAEWYAYAAAINTDDGSLSDNFGSNQSGAGYSTENIPEVTITGLAGWGSGAVVKPLVNTNGTITDLILMQKGEGYVRDINDYDGDNISGEEEDGMYITSFDWISGKRVRIYNLKPGVTYSADVFYGTGMVLE